MSVGLGALVGRPQAQLDGFKTRTLRVVCGAPPTQRHLYVTEWIPASEAADCAEGAAMLVFGGEELQLPGCERLAAQATRRELTDKLRSGEWAHAAAVVAMGRACHARLPLSGLQVALELVQAQADEARAPTVWLLTAGAQQQVVQQPQHAGVWGLAWAARNEAKQAVRCVDAGLATAALTQGLLYVAPELVIGGDTICAPQLKTAPPSYEGLVRLQFHSRGAISNLFLEAQPVLTLSDESAPSDTPAEVSLCVRAIDLNFRDVINVLGEYPGDPGPPGGDSGGVVVDADQHSSHVVGVAVFGHAHAPLACMARARALWLARKPKALSFEQASTLPVTWCTTHIVMERASLRAGCTAVLQAAAGGVGLKSVEYAQWLSADTFGTAGRPHKHAPLRGLDVTALCSSRDGSAFGVGAAKLLRARRVRRPRASATRSSAAWLALCLVARPMRWRRKGASPTAARGCRCRCAR